MTPGERRSNQRGRMNSNCPLLPSLFLVVQEGPSYQGAVGDSCVREKHRSHRSSMGKNNFNSHVLSAILLIQSKNIYTLSQPLEKT